MNTLTFYPQLVAVTGSITSALMLSQCLHWQEQAGDDGFWSRSRDDFLTATGLTVNELRGARTRLLERGFIKCEKRGSDGFFHFSVDKNALDQAMRRSEIHTSEEVKSTPAKEWKSPMRRCEIHSCENDENGRFHSEEVKSTHAEFTSTLIVGKKTLQCINSSENKDNKNTIKRDTKSVRPKNGRTITEILDSQGQPEGWPQWREAALQRRPDCDPQRLLWRFVNYWSDRPGSGAYKLSWIGTWRNFLDDDRLHGAVSVQQHQHVRRYV